METCIEEQCEFRGSLEQVILSEGLEIPGYEDYKVFKEGFVVSFKNVNKPKVLKTGKAGYNRNYHLVYLCKDGKPKAFYIHRLVALAFIPNGYKERDQVNHIDGNTDNNHYRNLEWSSPYENSNHAVDTGLTLTGESCPWAKVSEVFVRDVCRLLQEGKDTKEIMSTTGIDSRRLFKIRSRRQWKQVSQDYDF